ncbi:hypothetical protein BX661DRAFT_172825 [Kickxella alabastrina]|uniref:uncharacterized protein n=1 Tax=Kickxella alabastrina TaxID=61397 RepID=UPI002220D614|nr:uncharacterized protein BX661DRAFT_172825 [Kickxella alabastrina]KAI7823073.1 hypothetical protein BX661DRAFT_172825 [Kickxella alabastrina]
MNGDRDRCLWSGMDEYVTKPLRVESLLSAIERFNPRMFNENGEIVPIIDPVSSDSSDSNDGSPGDNHDGDYGVHDYEFSDDEGDNGGNADNGDDGFSDSSTSDESLTRDTASPFATSAAIASAGRRRRGQRHIGSGRLKGSKGKSSRGRFDPSSSDIHTAAFTHARALAMSKPPARDGSEAEEDPSLRAMRQMRAARELRKWVRLYKREYGDDLDKMPGMSDIKAKLKGKAKKTTDGADGENRPAKSPVISQPLGSGSSEEGARATFCPNRGQLLFWEHSRFQQRSSSPGLGFQGQRQSAD